MRKLYILIFLLFLAGGASFYFWKDLNYKSALDDPLINNLEIPKIAEKTTNPAAESGIVSSTDDALMLESKSLLSLKVNPKFPSSGNLAKIEELRDLLKKDYKNFLGWLDFGNYLSVVGDYNNAIRVFKFVSRLNPLSFIPFHNLGSIYAFNLNDYKTGEDYFIKAIAINPEDLDAMLILADYYKRTGRWQEALNYFETALKLNPLNRQDIEKEIELLRASF